MYLDYIDRENKLNDPSNWISPEDFEEDEDEVEVKKEPEPSGGGFEEEIKDDFESGSIPW